MRERFDSGVLRRYFRDYQFLVNKNRNFATIPGSKRIRRERVSVEQKPTRECRT